MGYRGKTLIICFGCPYHLLLSLNNLREVKTETTILEMLKGISFFSNMSEYDLKQIVSIITVKNYDKGAAIIEEMTEAERFFIIYKGKIEITKRFEDGEEFVLSVQSDGDFFGEMALLDEGRRSATVRALDPTTVLEISRNDFDTLLYKAPVLAYGILKELSARLRETGALLISHLKHGNRQLYRAYIDTMTMIMQVIDKRDVRADSRASRVRALTLALGKELGLSEEEMLDLELGSLFHDLGMLAVHESILGKEGPLAPGELDEIKRHVEAGAQMVMGVPMLAKAVPLALSHHERFDGHGYPRGLSGAEIPLASRIIALSDAFVAMTRDRPYKRRITAEAAVEELRGASGSQFDPLVVDAFLRVIETVDDSILSGPEPT
jgi:HD-GYP domain-containing protein (c-di-GMP phosphodiesterase class II)